MTKTTMAEFLRRGHDAQTAVDRVLDAVGTTGGKVTTETVRPRRDSMDKIRLKGGPKQYKTGKPGLSGRERLQARVNKLLVDCARYVRKSPDVDDRVWAARLGSTLRDFNEWQP